MPKFKITATEVEMTEELALSDYERGFLMGVFEFEAKQKMREEGFDDPTTEETFWIGVQCGTRMFDLAINYMDKNINVVIYECSPSNDGTNWVTNMSLASERLI